jgi:hypothetical protein
MDLRVCLACRELVARRCGAAKGALVRYTFEEVQRLVHARSPGVVRSSVRRLSRAGFLHWTDAAITFLHTPLLETAAVEVGVSPNRLVPVPRRTLRFLAAGTTRSLAATMLGTLLRCAFYQRGVCSWTGACKAGWLAEVFGIDERSVKRARARLHHLGWLSTESIPQWRLNRFGGRFRVHPGWKPATESTRPMTPRSPLDTARMSPPESDQQPLRACTHQELAPNDAAGVRAARRKQPSLRDIAPVDLRRRDRLLALHAQACMLGLAEPGEAGRLRFAALAARARRVGTVNPCGLLAWMLRGQRWSHITLEDEDRARRWLAPTPGRGPSAAAHPDTPVHVAAALHAVLPGFLRADAGPPARVAAWRSAGLPLLAVVDDLQVEDGRHEDRDNVRDERHDDTDPDHEHELRDCTRLARGRAGPSPASRRMHWRLTMPYGRESRGEGRGPSGHAVGAALR